MLGKLPSLARDARSQKHFEVLRKSTTAVTQSHKPKPTQTNNQSSIKNAPIHPYSQFSLAASPAKPQTWYVSPSLNSLSRICAGRNATTLSSRRDPLPRRSSSSLPHSPHPSPNPANGPPRSPQRSNPSSPSRRSWTASSSSASRRRRRPRAASSSPSPRSRSSTRRASWPWAPGGWIRRARM